MMNRNTGKQAEKEFELLMKRLGKQAYVYRVTDSAEVHAMNGKGFTKRQPSDYVVVESGVTSFAEVKSSNNTVSFPFSNIKDAQWAAAKMITTAGGSYIFFLKNEVTNKWFKVPALVLLNHTSKSMKWQLLEPYRWNLSYDLH